MVWILLKILFIPVALILIGVILIQRSRGGGLAGAFGGGGGSDTFLGAIQNREIVTITRWLAGAFIVLAILLDFNPPDRDQGDFGTIGATGGLEVGAEPEETESGDTLFEGAPLEEGVQPVQDDVMPQGQVPVGAPPSSEGP